MTTNGVPPYPLIVGRPRTGAPFSPVPPVAAYVPPPQTPPAVAPVFIVGLDLGQAQDYSAIVVDEATRINPGADAAAVYTHRIVHLERPRLGTAYPQVVQRVLEVCAALPVPPTLAIDGTGVGRAVVDLFRQAQPRCTSLLPVTITAGHEAAAQLSGYWHVPKRDLVGCVSVALQNKRLAVARALPEAGTLQRELLAFKARITPSGNVSYGASDWRENQHDDLVLATALALWAVSRPQWNWTAY